MKVKKAFLIGFGDEITHLPQLEGKELSLKDLYPLIGNHCHLVERVALKKGVDLWVDEEGLLKANYINEFATGLYQAAHPNGVFPGEGAEVLKVVGKAVLIDNTKAGNFLN